MGNWAVEYGDPRGDAHVWDLREDKDLSQTELAKLLGMSQTGYSKYETGENGIPVAILGKLADLCHTGVDYLLGRTDQRAPYPPNE